MKSRLLKLLVPTFIIFTYSSFGQIKNDLLRESLKGNVKSIIVEFLSIMVKPARDNRNTTYKKGKFYSQDIFEFDELGNLKEISTRYSRGMFLEKHIYEYNTAGKGCM